MAKAALVALFAALTLGVSAGAKSATYVVVEPVSNMYAAPTEQSGVVSQAMYGDNVTLLMSRGEWSRVQTADHYKGWIPSRHLRLIQVGDGYATAGPTVQVESLFANVYREPDATRHKPLITIPFETRLEMFPEDDASQTKAGHENWVHVELPEKREGWIQAGDVVADPKPLTIAESVDLAKRFLGLPYLWGGRSTFGFDCSGFTQMLMRMRGVNMPREVDQQAAWSGLVAIDRKDLQAGDLLFFGSSVRKITGAGMYIGDDQFIQAAASGHPVVQVSRLDDQPWTTLLVACRRAK